MNLTSAQRMSPSGAIVCTDLYPTDQSRTSLNDTFAIRDLVEGARSSGADIRGVIRFKPLVGPGAFNRAKLWNSTAIPVVDVPRMGTLRMFSTLLTRKMLQSVYTFSPPPKLFVCHLSKSFYMAKRVLKRRGTRFVLVVHSSDIGFPLLRWCLQEADAVYCRSHAIASQLRGLGYSCKGIVASGVPQIDLGEPTRPMGDALRIVIATRFIPLRNVVPCLEAIRDLPGNKVVVDIFGDGPLEGEVRSFVENNQLSSTVRMHGFRPREEVLEAMSRAHLFLMPSAPETFGLAYLEAMAKGCVVVGHKGWGIDGLVVDGVNGYLVPSPEPSHIRARILSYLSSNRNELHQRSFTTAQRNTSEQAISQYAGMIESELAET